VAGADRARFERPTKAKLGSFGQATAAFGEHVADTHLAAGVTPVRNAIAQIAMSMAPE